MQRLVISSINKNTIFSAAVFIFLMPAIYFVGIRKDWVGTDTQNYIFFFQNAENCKCIPDEMEFLFGLMARLTTVLSSSEAVFFGLVSLVQFLAVFFLIELLNRQLKYENSKNSFALFFLTFLLASPFFLSMQINVLRQGISAVFVASAIILFQQRRFGLAVGLTFVAIGFHYSALLYVLFFPLIFFSYKKIKWIFFVLLISYITSTSEQIVRGISELSGLPVYGFLSDYGSGSDYRAGVRLDFVAFSVMPYISLFFISKIQEAEINLYRFQKMSSVYLVLLFPFMIFGWTAYSDRYAIGAWLLIPVFATLVIMRLIRRKYHWISALSFLLALALFIIQLDFQNATQQ